MIPAILNTRDDLEKTLLSLLEPLQTHYVPDGLHLGYSGCSYSPRVARLEAWSRLLWGIAPLLAGGGTYPLLKQHREILIRCTNPESPYYWGTPGNKDQRLVEMAPLAFALLLAREWFWDPLTEREKENLYRWLSTIQYRELPRNNWHFFRILVCTAFRFLDLPIEKEAEEESFQILEQCYRGNGWYIDGTNATYDLYNPSGFHFYGLLYAKFFSEWVQRLPKQYRSLKGQTDAYMERARQFTERTQLFAPQYLAWFREDGSFVPFGRSLTYRFVAASFFSACAFAELSTLSMGVLKGVILRHLRYWFSRPILDSEGLLTIGYGYPNLVMAEQYNAPGSPYWGLKTFLILALPPHHPFWTAIEEPLPTLPEVTLQGPPGFIVSRTKEDVLVLNPGYYPGWESIHSSAKYGKFSYSARFGFCVSHGSYGLEKTGCDSMLVLSEGDGYWRERRQTHNVRYGDRWTASTWYPWPEVQIETLLISLGFWHVRIHRIKTLRPLQSVEGGFSVTRYLVTQGRIVDPEPAVNYVTDPPGVTVSFPWAASRIVELSPSQRIGENRKSIKPIHLPRSADLLYPEPNLNVLEPSVVVPVLKGTVEAGVTLWACAVRAGDSESTVHDSIPYLSCAPDGTLSLSYKSDLIPLPFFKGFLE
ncbi:MAG: DUF2264 domain-containing protein [Spirochaetes bacterium]|nr:DUF2264 domain-containing protein [Spirochaetota bacterium]